MNGLPLRGTPWGMTKLHLLLLAVLFTFGCSAATEPGAGIAAPAPSAAQPEAACLVKNACTDYATYWSDSCPAGSRCLTFKNSCTDTVALAYQVGCNSDGSKGAAPQCNCTDGPVLAPGASAYFAIVDGNYADCQTSWTPACLTEGLAVLANPTTASCTSGSRIEFTAGNSAAPYGKFDSYNLDIETGWYSVPVSFKPDISCAKDHAGHDCRPLWCNSDTCPDAYATPTTGGCADGRSPQVGCQDTFSDPHGLTVEFCPAGCATTGSACPSCQDATACPSRVGP